MSIAFDLPSFDDRLDFTRFREREVRDRELLAERLTGAVTDELVTLAGPLAAVASVLNAVASPEHGSCDLDVLPTLMPPEPVVYRAVLERLSAADCDAEVLGLIHHFHHRLALVSRATRPALFRGAPELGGTIDVTALADAWRDLSAAIIDIVGRVQELGCLSPGSAARFERVLGVLLEASEGGTPCLQADGCVEVPGILERRKYERHDVYWMAWIIHHGEPVSVAVRDISQGGVGLDCEIPLPLGATVVLEIKDRRIAAQVAWSTTGRIGLEFDRALSSHDPLMRDARHARSRE
jgi:hypothetical protein